MKLLKKFSVLIAFVALNLYGSSAWAQDSFVAHARLNGDNVVPSVLTTVPGELCLTISEPETSGQAIDQTLQQAGPRKPGLTLQPGGDLIGADVVENVRLYFGQDFANGQPILTLCDDDFKKDGCHVRPRNGDPRGEQVCTNPFTPDTPDDFQCEPLDFDLNSVQFQSEQIGFPEELNQVDGDGRLHHKACDPSDNLQPCGFLVIKDLIDRGLIYVVVNSDFKAKLRKDGTIRYKPPKGPLAVDGDLRGTLSKDECPPIPPPVEE